MLTIPDNSGLPQTFNLFTKKPKKTTVSAKHNKVKGDKMRYAI